MKKKLLIEVYGSVYVSNETIQEDELTKDFLSRFSVIKESDPNTEDTAFEESKEHYNITEEEWDALDLTIVDVKTEVVNISDEKEVEFKSIVSVEVKSESEVHEMVCNNYAVSDISVNLNLNESNYTYHSFSSNIITDI